MTQCFHFRHWSLILLLPWVLDNSVKKRNTPAFDVADGSSHRYASAMDGGAVKAPRGLEPASRLRVEPSFLQKDRHRRCLQMILHGPAGQS
jgi:hypothetical protein